MPPEIRSAASKGWRIPSAEVSLPEVHGSIPIPHGAGFWRKMFAFAGPGYLVAVGYMDPGNWATDLAGGARYGYTLLSVIMVSNFMAILLQAIAACDLAEVVGAAIALNLLFHIPLLWGVILTALDVLIVLFLQGRGFRYVEALVIALIFLIAGSFAIEIWLSRPDFTAIAVGFIPQAEVLRNPSMLYIAIGILGATVMPHNLYLHSSIVQTRKYGDAVEDRREAIRFASIDSAVALMFALFINGAILVM